MFIAHFCLGPRDDPPGHNVLPAVGAFVAVEAPSALPVGRVRPPGLHLRGYARACSGSAHRRAIAFRIAVACRVAASPGTISGNYSDRYGGAISTGSGKLSIVNSTISGNVGGYTAAVSAYHQLTISNSTIAGNVTVPIADQPCANSVAVRASTSLHLDSSILADTSCSGAPSADLQVLERVVTGSDNLVERVAVGTPLPPDTLSTDPMLAPLADNGGVRLTHALMPGSPAIDTGSNPLNLQYYQRWGFPRTNGPGTDIGAYEK